MTTQEARNRRYLTRRDFLHLATAALATGMFASCAPAAQPSATSAPAPNPTPAKPSTLATAAAAAQTPAPTQAPAAAPAPGGPKRGGTFTLARGTSNPNLDPYVFAAGNLPFQRAMYNSLAHYDAQLNPQPELAEKWNFSADGKTVTLNLRQGVNFHSGREFTSADVVFSVGYAKQSETSPLRVLHQTIKQVDTPDKYTAVFQFDQVPAGIFDMLDTLFVVDKETIADRAKTAVGTGAFKLDKYIPNDRVEMVPFKDYWDRGKPYLDRYVARQIPDKAALSLNLETGAVDCVWELTFPDVVRLKGLGGKFAIDMGAPGYEIYDVGVNTKVAPFTDKRVRQAMAWSIDRARFCKTILQGLAQPTCLMWPTHSWAYFKDLEGKIGFDLDKAKSLLKEAGLEKGFETEILTASKGTYGVGELAVMMQADLAKIGVNAKVSDVEEAQYSARMSKGDIQLMTHSYGRTNRDPGTLVTGAKAWYNEKQGGWTHFESAQYDQLRQDLQSTLDREKRQAICRKIQELALDECFTITIAPADSAFAYAGYVKGFGYSMDDAANVGEVWLDK